MSKKLIFIVEDEEDIVSLLEYNLEQEGYEVRHVMSGSAALEEIPKVMPDLVLLDLMIPDVEGFDVCKALKANSKTAGIPIIMVSAKAQEHTIVAGLELGADDYVTKPFSLSVLIARIRVVLRKQKQLKQDDASDHIKVGDLEIFTKKHEVLVANEPIKLNSTEFKLLLYLASNVDWVFTRNQLLDEIKGDDVFVTDRSIDVLMVSLRKKLNSASNYLETIRGVGYRLTTPQ